MKAAGDDLEAALTAQIESEQARRLQLVVMEELLTTAGIDAECAAFAVDNRWRQAQGLDLPLPKLPAESTPDLSSE